MQQMIIDGINRSGQPIYFVNKKNDLCYQVDIEYGYFLFYSGCKYSILSGGGIKECDKDLCSFSKGGAKKIAYNVIQQDLQKLELDFQDSKKRILEGLDKYKYKDLTLESTLTKEEAIACYLSITRLNKMYGGEKLKKKKTMTIKEIIDLMKGECGIDTFRQYFE